MMGRPGRASWANTADANTSAFCCASAPANDIGAVAPAVGQGSAPNATPARAASIIASATSSGKISGLMGEMPKLSTSGGGPMTAAIWTAKRTSAAVCTPGPCTGLTAWGSACRYIASDISGPDTSWGVKKGVIVVTLSNASSRRVASRTSWSVAGRRCAVA
jgi:hypothetical protein